METKPAKTNKQELQHYNIAQPNDVIAMSGQLQKFIKEQKLTTGIQGKDYVNVEGWQFAGAMLGIVPVVEYCKNISTADELKYEASVFLTNLQTGQMVGRGIAICSKLEQKKRYFDEYAIASMAQTRAIGKAYRNVLAFVMRAAGFEPTPAEEMDFNSPEKEEAKPQPAPAPKAQQTTEEPATDKQKALIISLVQSHVFTEEEQAKVLDQVETYSKVKAMKVTENITKTLNERKAQEKAKATAA